MLGLPDETLKDMEESLRFAKKVDPDWCQFNIFIAYPDSKLYQEILATKKYTRLDDYLLSVKTDEYDNNSLLKIQRRFFREFHGAPKQIIKRVRREGVLNFVKRRLNRANMNNAGMA